MRKAFILLLLPTLSGCMLLRDPSPAIWFYTFSEGPASHRDTQLTPASFIEFRTDGTYTLDMGEFEYGKWLLTRDAIQLFAGHNEEHRYTYLRLKSQTPNELQLIIDDNVTAHYERRPMPKNMDEDPFSLVNNRWRIPAERQENDQEIRQRLFNHCQFWETYFTWALHYKIPTIDVRSTPTPIKIYGNGFALKRYEDWPAEWKYSFNNKQDRLKAYDILKDIFEHKNIGWPQTGNKYEMFIGAFQQMENFLR